MTGEFVSRRCLSYLSIVFAVLATFVASSALGSVIAPEYAVIHYLRSDGDYGDHTTGDFNDYWGLHLWGDGIDSTETTDWTDPKPFLGEDEYGRFAWVKLAPSPGDINFIVHRGDTKDGTNADRTFPSSSPEVWLKQDDANNYSSQAAAQDFVRIHYHRDDGDYGDPTSSDFNDFWGIHLWGDAIDPSEGTNWTTPKVPDGVDDFGAYFDVALDDPTKPVNFIIHRGDTKDPGPDQGFTPDDSAGVWINSGDETVYTQRGEAEGVATVHYHRPDGDYGDYSSGDYNDFWGMHVWTGAADQTGWTEPLKPDYIDIFGPAFLIELVDDATQLSYILHRGDIKDPGPDQILDFATYGYEVWQLQGANPQVPYILPINYSALNAVPLPPTIVLLSLGIAGVGCQRYRLNKAA